jgi:heptosyltransferase-2
MVTALRKRDPNVQISWLCGEGSAPLVELMGDIEIIAVNDAKLLDGSLLERTLELTKLWRRLFGRSFDLVLTCYMDSRARLFTLTALAKERRKCSPRRKGWWAVPGRYQGDEYVRLVTEVDDSDMQSTPLPSIATVLSARMQKLLEPAEKPFIAIAPGGGKNVLVEEPLRRWPLTSFRLLAECLIKKGYRVVVTGGATDEWVSEGFTGLNVVNLVGHTSLIDLLAIYGASYGVITHDSGPLHLAMLADAPTVALFGPTMPSEKVRIRPSGKPVMVLWGGADLPCRPCFDGKAYAPCGDNKCMTQISVTQVIAALEQVANLGKEREKLVTTIRS